MYSNYADDPRQKANQNTIWYLQRLKTSSNSIKSNVLPRQGDHISLKLPMKSIQVEPTKQKYGDTRTSRSMQINSASSSKSASTNNPMIPLSSDFISNSYQSLTTVLLKDDKDSLTDRRSSSGTLLFSKPDIRNASPSTYIDQRCHRAYSSTTNSIERETCSILGPQLCSDCIQIQIRANLSSCSSSSSSTNSSSIRQRLSALALRRFIKNHDKLTDNQLIEMINNNQIELIQKSSEQIRSTILTDDQYFDHLSALLNRYAGQSSPYYFKNLNDFAQKYHSNKYQRLLLSETPAPTSSNPLFQDHSVEKFNISKKYSYMKRASTIKPDKKCSTTVFISSKMVDPFHLKHRSLQDFSPTLLLRETSASTKKHQTTLIGSKYSQQHTVHI